MKKLALLLAMLMVFSLLTGFTGSRDLAAADGDAQPAAEGENKIVIGITTDPATLSPWASRNLGRIEVLQQVYQTLVEENPTTHEIDLSMVQSYEQVGPMKWTCTLYDGIKDSEGNPFKASDVVYSYMEAKATGNHALLNQIVNVTEVDDLTAEFEFNHELGYGELMTLWTEIFVTTQAAYEASEDGMSMTPVGTGPYVVKSYTVGSSIVLEANKDFWKTDESLRVTNEKQNVDIVEYRIINDTAQIAIGLQNGQIDASFGVAAADVPSFSEGGAYAENFTVQKSLHSGVMSLAFNCGEDSICHDYNLRMALALCFDSDAVINLAYGGDALKVSAVGKPTLGDYEQSWTDREYFEYDLDLAKEYLQKYLDETGQSAGDVTIRLVSGNTDNNDDIAEALYSFISALGVNVDLQIYDTETTKTTLTDPTAWDCTTTIQLSSSNTQIKMWKNVFDNTAFSWGGTKNFIFDDTLQDMLMEVCSLDGHTSENMIAFQNYLDENCYIKAICSAYVSGVVPNWITKVAVNPSGNRLVPGACEFDWTSKG